MSKSEWRKRIILTKAKTCLINHALECYSSLRNLKDNSCIKLNVIRQIRLAFYIEDIFCKISNGHWLEYFFLLYAINVKGSNGHFKKPQKGTMILSLLRAGKFQNVPFQCFQSLGDISSLKRFLWGIQRTMILKIAIAKHFDIDLNFLFLFSL